MDAWSQERHDVGRHWQHLFKGEACERSQSNITPTPRIIGRRRNSPIGFGHVTRYMAAEHLPPTIYANPRRRVESWDKYTPSESSTEYYTQDTDDTDDTVTDWKERDVTWGVFPGWQDLR